MMLLIRLTLILIFKSASIGLAVIGACFKTMASETDKALKMCLKEMK